MHELASDLQILTGPLVLVRNADSQVLSPCSSFTPLSSGGQRSWPGVSAHLVGLTSIAIVLRIFGQRIVRSRLDWCGVAEVSGEQKGYY